MEILALDIRLHVDIRDARGEGIPFLVVVLDIAERSVVSSISVSIITWIHDGIGRAFLRHMAGGLVAGLRNVDARVQRSR